MKENGFIDKLRSPLLWGNLLAMALVVVAAVVGVAIWLSYYTHHGDYIEVPQLQGMKFAEAEQRLELLGLQGVVVDSGYNKRLQPGCVLAQMPEGNERVKQGRTIYLTVNSATSPTMPIPDLIDNSSYREANARLTAIGFRMMPPKRISGERDWVYGIECDGRPVTTGDKVSIESPLTLVIGSGLYGDDETEAITDVEFTDDEIAQPNEEPITP